MRRPGDEPGRFVLWLRANPSGFTMPASWSGAMDNTSFRNWLDAYGRAWQERNPQAAEELYAEDGTYQVTPFLEPMRGRKAIRAYWDEVTATEKDIRFSCEILVTTEAFGIARWRASFERTPPGLQTKLDGIFLIELDASGKCTSLREWWHKQQ